MKKIVAAVIAAISLGAAASALDLSAGALFDYTFDHQFGKEGNVEASVSSNALGGKAFFDAQYAQVQLGVNSTVGKTKLEAKGDGKKATKEWQIDIIYFNAGVFGKYPFAVGPAKIYPMLGFDFDIAVSAKFEGTEIEKKEDLNSYWTDAGVGADIFITDHFYIKPEFLFGVQMNKQERNEEPDTNGIKVNAGIGAGWKF